MHEITLAHILNGVMEDYLDVPEREPAEKKILMNVRLKPAELARYHRIAKRLDTNVSTLFRVTMDTLGRRLGL